MRAIDPMYPHLSISEQCSLLGLPRSSYYYQPAVESDENLLIMRLIDEQFLKTPYYGVEKMTAHLKNEHGLRVNPKRVRRLSRKMGIMPIYQKPRTSIAGKGHHIFPYLLRGMDITACNQVWSSDITYIPMSRGFMYLTAVIDWYSRYVLSWELSNTMDAGFCLTCLNQALKKKKPIYFNTDQGTQFTCSEFVNSLKDADVQISMDGRGRALDNVFIERLWRSLKYELIYINCFQDGWELEAALQNYFTFYNHARIHQSLDYLTPAQIYGEQQ